MADATAGVPGLSGQAELDKLENDKKRLEDELKYVQLQMTDTLSLNDGLLIDLRQKDETLTKRNEYYSIINEKNATELQQLELEADCAEQKCENDVNFAQSQMHRLQLRREKYLQLKAENDGLLETFDNMQTGIAEISFNHAERVHEMNKDMMMVRENLESKLRKELTAMDLKYQQMAFSSLNDADKRDIFENAKLNDEVTLQSIGIANLSLRLGKQKHGTRMANKERGKLATKASSLRDQLSDHQLTKLQRTSQIDQLAQEIESLNIKREHLDILLHRDMELDALVSKIEASVRKIKHERLSAELWQRRLEAAYTMQDYMIPTDDREKSGKFSSETHKLISTTSSLAGLSSAGMHGSQRVEDSYGAGESKYGGAKLADISEAMSRDRFLNKALKGLIGKESIIIGGKGGQKGENQVEDQNMAAWVICEVMKDWMASKTCLQKSFDSLERAASAAPRHDIIDADDAFPAASRDTATRKVEKIGNDEDSMQPEDRDDAWDEVFTANLEDVDKDLSWYKLRDSARRIPDGIRVGLPPANERFNFDAIRPANLTYDLDPPINKSGVSERMGSLTLKTQLASTKHTIDDDGEFGNTAGAAKHSSTSRGAKREDKLKSSVHQQKIYSGSGMALTSLKKAHSTSALHKQVGKGKGNRMSSQKL